MRVDAHQHFWKYEPAQYPWIKPNWPIRRDFLPADLEPLLKQARIDGCVAVQARQSMDESRWLLQLASQHSMIRGVVGWVDLRSAHVAKQLHELAGNPRFVGVRHVVQDEPDSEFMMRPDFVRGLGRVGELGLVYDMLVFPRQLPAAIRLARRFPRQRFVVDHIAKPPIKSGGVTPWAWHIRELAQNRNVFCKISGMVTEADWRRWKAGDFTRYLETVFDAFGPERLMYGSDWPVCLLAGTYREVHDLAARYCERLSQSEKRQVFGETAARVYGLK